MTAFTQALDIRALLKEAMARLRAGNVPSHTLAAELLLMHVLGRERAWLYAHYQEPAEPAMLERYFELVAQRIAGVPTQHLTGKQEFWGLEFEVTPDVLIPRPETEHVVEVALDRLGVQEAKYSRTQDTQGLKLQIADVGTGSGCIAIALARELPNARFHATDISAAPLAVARRNAERHGVAARIDFDECNLLEGLINQQSRPFDLIVSNPPYIGLRERETLPREIRDHEPEIALFAGEDGTALYPALIAQAAERLRPEGLLVLEIGQNSLLTVWALFETPAWTNIGVTHDLAGIPRVIAAERL